MWIPGQTSTTTMIRTCSTIVAYVWPNISGPETEREPQRILTCLMFFVSFNLLKGELVVHLPTLQHFKRRSLKNQCFLLGGPCQSAEVYYFSHTPAGGNIISYKVVPAHSDHYVSPDWGVWKIMFL